MRVVHSFGVMVVVCAAGLAGIAGGCGGSLGSAGTAGGGCYGNGTCNSGLACVSNHCINPNGTDGGGGLGTGGASGTGGSGGTAGTFTTTFGQVNNEIDILFMIDDSSSMAEMQTKLYAQLPTFMQVLESLPTPPSLHVAVVSSDMGAPGDSTTSIQCTAMGDQGQFQSMPRGTCTATSLTNGDTFISDADMMPNYTDADLATVFQCIALLGDKGCGFEHQLASIDRALGADGSAPPSTNAGFLRPEAYLGIVILTNEDDCSARANSTIYSLNGGQQNISNPDGPISNYRCNGGPRGAHLCQDPATGAMIVPPLKPPADVQMTGTTPTLDLANCQDNETGSSALTPVTQFVTDIKALKPDPDNQIVVAAIAGPASPYTVAWVPGQGAQNPQTGELWPQIEHSCGMAGSYNVNPKATMSPTDGSFGDPGVRISQFVNSFQDSVLASVCDASYAISMQAIATKLGQLVGPPCIKQTIRSGSNGTPMCTVTLNVQNGNVTQSTAIPNCTTNNDIAPCWTLSVGTANCTDGARLTVNALPTAQSQTTTVTCSVCQPGSTLAGC